MYSIDMKKAANLDFSDGMNAGTEVLLLLATARAKSVKHCRVSN